MRSDKSAQESVEEVFVFPASFAQQRLWFIGQLIPESSIYVIPLAFRLTGIVQLPQFQQSLQSLIQRHESLRTTFDVVNGQLAQVIASALPVPLELSDLRTLPASCREGTAIDQLWHELQQPFQLDQGPLFRVRLWQLQDTEHLLLLALHHIIFDEWSSGVLIRELGELYRALVEERPAALPELPIQYADFAHWQREWLQGETLNAQLRYWKQQLADLPKLNLPGVIPRRDAQGHQGASQWLELPQRLLDALEALSQQAGVTLFMTLLAAFQTLLHRYTGQTDIAVGSPIANRHRSELEGLIGFLVNSLVLRTDLTGDPTFRELLDRVQAVTLAAYAHQDLPFEKLVEELQPMRSFDQNPLFQVVFALQNTPMEQLTLPGLVLSSVELETKTSRFALELYLWKSADNFRNLWGKDWQQSDGLRGVIVYNTNLFDSTTITSLQHHFQTLLEEIVANPEAPLSALSLLTVAEQQASWQHSNQPSYPTACIHRLFEAQVQQQSMALAVQFPQQPSQQSAQQSFTYQALNQGSNQLARYLQRFGVKAEMPVGICLERGVEAIAAMLAVLKAGAAYVPLDPSYPPERLHFILEDAGITVVLTQTGWVDLLQTRKTAIICLEQAWSAIAQESDENLSSDSVDHGTGDDLSGDVGGGTAEQLAYIIYTSGSTGKPKGVMVPHRAVNRLVCGTDYVQIGSGDRVAQAANLAFDAATFEIWGALLNGAQLIGIARETTLSPVAFVAALQQHNISILFLTTALFNQTASHVPKAFQSLKYLLFGGEVANVDSVRLVLQQGKPQHLLHMYGPTENTTFSTWYEVQNIAENATTIPIGQAIANTQVYLLDANLKPVPAGGWGEIYLGGAGLARGYLNRQELTAERFIQLEQRVEQVAQPAMNHQLTLYQTGDRALYCPDGQLEFLGRTDHQVKLRGFRVELGEIEAAIVQHPAIQTAVVVLHAMEGSSLAEPLRERQLIAYVVPEAFLEAFPQTSSTPAVPTERELRAFLKSKLPLYMLPAAFITLDRLPLTANGKVDQKALPPPQTAVRETAVSSPTFAPTTLEAALIEIWTELLGRAAGIHDNFFELGGHSLLATQLVSRLRDRLQVELPLRSLFETPTIAALAAQITALQQSVPTSTVANRERAAEAEPREEIEL